MLPTSYDKSLCYVLPSLLWDLENKGQFSFVTRFWIFNCRLWILNLNHKNCDWGFRSVKVPPFLRIDISKHVINHKNINQKANWNISVILSIILMAIQFTLFSFQTLWRTLSVETANGDHQEKCPVIITGWTRLGWLWQAAFMSMLREL